VPAGRETELSEHFDVDASVPRLTGISNSFRMNPLDFRSPSTLLMRQGVSEGLANQVIIFVGICVVLYFGQDILIPVVLAIVLSILLTPVVRGLQKMRIPKPVAIIGVVCLSLLVLAGTTYLVGRTLTNLAADLPVYQTNLKEKARSLKLAIGSSEAMDKAADVLQDLQKEIESQPGSATAAIAPKPVLVEIKDSRLGPFAPVVSVISIVAHPLVQLGIVILMLTFMLFNREDLRNRIIRLAGTGDIHRTTVALDEAGKRLSRLFIGLLAINATTGAFVGIALFLLGVPAAFLWGLLTMILRFVPFIGTFMASVFPIIIALAVGDGWMLPLAVAGVVAVAEISAGNILEPIFLGKMTGVSSTAIVISAAFWAMIWGPVGLILSTPITIGLMVIGRHIESMKFLEVMFGSEPVLSAEDAFYQRMLAGDSMEAAESAQDFLEENRLQEYLEKVAVPGLLLARVDQDRGVLTRERTKEVSTTFEETINDVWTEVEDGNAEDPKALLISNLGSLNYAATVALSALLELKGVDHKLLPEDAVTPGKFPVLDLGNIQFVCVCSLNAQSQAKMNYVNKRLQANIGNARIIHVAWDGLGERLDVISPISAVTILTAE
jgi:predicted PurR-regulated permease PerM